MKFIIWNKSNDKCTEEIIIPVNNILYVRKFANTVLKQNAYQIEIHLVNGEKLLEMYPSMQELNNKYNELLRNFR